MTILNSNGNVGIGTATPRGKLEVLNGSPNTDADPAGDLTVVGGNKSMGGTGLEAANLSIQTNDGNNVNSGGSIGFGSRYNNTQFANYAAIKGARDNGTAGNYSGYLIFGTRTNGGSTTERMRITSGGFVGIGTAIPSEKLTIAGGHTDTKIRLTSSGNGGDQPSNLSLWASEPGWTYTGTGIGYNVNGSPNYGRIDNTRGSSYIRFLPGETKFQFQNASGTNVDALTIKDNGFVGIGVGNTSPDAPLTVNGTIHAKEVKIEISGAVVADYVFKPNYKLMPLNKVEEYVKTNNHLPEIPSAEEVGKNGMNMGEMQNKLLQKVEELTLYAIELQKTVNAQSNQISAQNAKIEELQKKIK